MPKKTVPIEPLNPDARDRLSQSMREANLDTLQGVRRAFKALNEALVDGGVHVDVAEQVSNNLKAASTLVVKEHHQTGGGPTTMNIHKMIVESRSKTPALELQDFTATQEILEPAKEREPEFVDAG